MTTKRPLVDRLRERMLLRLTEKGLNVAAEYAFAVTGQWPQHTQAMISAAPEPLKSLLAAASRGRIECQIEAKRSEKECATTDRIAAVAQADAVRAALASDYEASRRIGQVAVYLAALPPSKRDAIGTKSERDAALTLRRECARSTEVKLLLGCSASELERWTADGRLPVLFRRKMLASFGSCEVRHWSRDSVVAAAAMTEDWRVEDATAKQLARAKSAASRKAAP